MFQHVVGVSLTKSTRKKCRKPLRVSKIKRTPHEWVSKKKEPPIQGVSRIDFKDQ